MDSVLSLSVQSGDKKEREKAEHSNSTSTSTSSVLSFSLVWISAMCASFSEIQSFVNQRGKQIMEEALSMEIDSNIMQQNITRDDLSFARRKDFDSHHASSQLCSSSVKAFSFHCSVLGSPSCVGLSAEAVKMHTDLKVGMYFGDLGVDFWNASTWKQEMEKHELLFALCTPYSAVPSTDVTLTTTPLSHTIPAFDQHSTRTLHSLSLANFTSFAPFLTSTPNILNFEY
ncbi:hypothetical protein VNO78_32892 [Psophocarpus tetragonolobus]|uniref:Uncharacterized protein n=1 Tax=Psophocarpus tetragonolobus TaxID=3891 RepID=A0AAN9NWY6_PSOTE